MTEPTAIITALKVIGGSIVAGLLSLFGYLFRKQDTKISSLEQRIHTTEVTQAVYASKHDDLKDDVGEVKKDVHELRKELKEGIEKVLNRLEKLK